MPTDDGYPTEEELRRIIEWRPADWLQWMEFIKSCWWAADWGWAEYDGRDDYGEPTRFYSISTGGWSGNEDIIAAMRENFCGWAMAWCEHRRGGHYRFEVRLGKEGQ